MLLLCPRKPRALTAALPPPRLRLVALGFCANAVSQPAGIASDAQAPQDVGTRGAPSAVNPGGAPLPTIKPAQPIQAPIQPLLRPDRGFTAQVGWQFADIRVTVLGPDRVKIDWAPLNGAIRYYVQRNGIQIGPSFQSDPAASAPLSYTDSSAQANSRLTYAVIATTPSNMVQLPGRPSELSHASNIVAVVTPALAVAAPVLVVPTIRWALRPDAMPSSSGSIASASRSR